MKNWRKVAGVGAVTVVTLSLLGGTLTKYTDTGTASSTTRVAKFSVKGTAKESNFNVVSLWENWNTPLELEKGKIKAPSLATEADVWSNVTDDNNVIAPGTSGKFDIDVVNDSEVTVKYKIELSNNSTAADFADIPLEFAYVDETTTPGTPKGEWGTLTDASKGLTGTLEQSKGSTPKTETITVYWRWLYENNKDAEDTALGKAADVLTKNYQLTASVNFEQVD